MIRWHKYGTARKRIVLRSEKGRRKGSRQTRQYWVEQLEARYLLTATPANPISLGAPMLPDHIATAPSLATGALLPTAPFPFEDTFHLSSLPGATKTIYLDFDGFTARNTIWNTAVGLPNIVTPNFTLDDDVLTFSEDELTMIQGIWERVTEDFRPFEVNVTTQDPGVEALRNTGGTDDQWGIRLVIGGSVQDWWAPIMGSTNPGRAYVGSFSWDSDTPAYIWSQEFIDPMLDNATIEKFIAEACTHETGHTLGLGHDGQTRFYKDVTDPMKPETGSIDIEYYGGHGTDPTSWAPIMGSGYVSVLTQWSKGEYWGATNIQDDLAIITSAQNGFGYLTDDHGNTSAAADPLELDPEAAEPGASIFVGEGNIEQNTDIDYFSFQVEGLGELVSFDIEPFYNGPNLDVLAKIYDSAGNVVATGDPTDDIGVSFTDLPLEPGTYYVSIQGASRPITYIDPAVHPGPPEITKDDPDDPVTEEMLPPDTSDWGYTNYGCLGYYSIIATQKKALVVGVDFDVANGQHPANWNSYAGGNGPTILTDLISETGNPVPYQLAISSTGPTITPHASAQSITAAEIPSHGIPLNKLAGYISTQTDTWTFTWSHLEPWSYHQVYVFGHADLNAVNDVTITGGNINGVVQTIPFEQTITANGLVVNSKPGTDEDLTTFSYLVLSDGDGQIQITVTPEQGSIAALAGLAIAATQPIGPAENGSISGQKWNDANGNRVKDAGDPAEQGLPGWTIYLDENNNGILDSETTPPQTVTIPSPNVPQALADYATTKNELVFAGQGSISDINVALDINHTYDSDLRVYLISPNGTRVKLFANIGGSGDNFHSTVLDDAATTSITVNSAPFTGTFRPQEPLSILNGENAHGTWQLEITDDGAGDTGVLNSWSITVTTPGSTVFLEPYTVTGADGSYSFPDLPAGLYHVREYFTPQQIFDQWVQSLAPTPITVTSAAAIQDVDFLNWQPQFLRGSIQGQKFSDANSNGVKDSGEPGLSGWTVYLDANGNGALDAATTPVTIASMQIPKTIKDLTVVTSNLTVGDVGSVYSVEVTLDITHSFVGDLTAYLISPSGKSVKLFDGVGGQYNNFQSLTLSDGAARSITSLDLGDVPYTGTWRPQDPLSDLIGENAAGIWTLQVRDNATGDEGILNSWSLKLTPGEFTQVTDADGNYTFDDLVPGSYVVREVPKAGWTQIAPATTTITAAEWSNSQWVVTIQGQDSLNPSNPNEPLDSRRNVKNVNFGNKLTSPPPGDFDGSHIVDASDYVLWRKMLGTVANPPFSGADGNGNGVVDAADYGVWRSHFGQVAGAGSALGSVTATGSALAAADLSPVLVQDAAAVSTTDGTSPSSSLSASSATVEASLTSGVVRAAPRPAYRPSAVATTTSDDALLAWLSESKIAASGEEQDDFLVPSDRSDDVDSVDNAFGDLEIALAGGGSVL